MRGVEAAYLVAILLAGFSIYDWVGQGIPPVGVAGALVIALIAFMMDMFKKSRR